MSERRRTGAVWTVAKWMGRHRLCVSLLLTCLVLLGALVYVGAFATTYFARVAARYELCEVREKTIYDYYSCVEGWTKSLKSVHAKADIVFFGNSLTHNGDWNEYFPDKRVCNLGCPGDGLDDMQDRVEQIEVVSPRKIFVMAGVNGVQYLSTEAFEQKYLWLIQSIRKGSPAAKVYILTILPVESQLKPGFNERIVRANERVKKVAKKCGCVCIDLYALYAVGDDMPKGVTRDGLHLKKESYTKWVEAVSPYVYDEGE